MKKVVSVLNKEIEKKKESVSSVIKASGTIQEGFEVKDFEAFLKNIQVSQSDYEELKLLEKVKTFIASLDSNYTNDKPKSKRGRPKKNQ